MPELLGGQLFWIQASFVHPAVVGTTAGCTRFTVLPTSGPRANEQAQPRLPRVTGRVPAPGGRAVGRRSLGQEGEEGLGDFLGVGPQQAMGGAVDDDVVRLRE